MDITIGLLDRVISTMMLASKDEDTDRIDRMTLKHHARDMIDAGRHILENLGETEERRSGAI